MSVFDTIAVCFQRGGSCKRMLCSVVDWTMRFTPTGNVGCIKNVTLQPAVRLYLYVRPSHAAKMLRCYCWKQHTLAIRMRTLSASPLRFTWMGRFKTPNRFKPSSKFPQICFISQQFIWATDTFRVLWQTVNLYSNVVFMLLFKHVIEDVPVDKKSGVDGKDLLLETCPCLTTVL